MDYQEMMMAQNAPNIPVMESGNGLGSILGTLSANSAKNTALSQSFAREQMQYQTSANAKAMEFNAEQAALNREWQKMMSDTAHQREVADLRAAGLNPILSAMGGNGASVGSGATASGVSSTGSKGEIDTSLNGALANVFGTLLNTQTNLEMANINARTQEAVADKYTAMSYLIEKMQEDFKVKYPQNWWTALESVFYKLFPDANNPGDIVEQGGKAVDTMAGNGYSSGKSASEPTYSNGGHVGTLTPVESTLGYRFRHWLKRLEKDKSQMNAITNLTSR